MPVSLHDEAQSERILELTSQLEEGVSEVFSSGRYQEYLTVMSRFHTYSAGNILLILMQKPDATHVAGFHAWKKQFGRSVKLGEHGIRILAPCPYRRFAEHDKLDESGMPILDADGNPTRERTIVQMIRYRIVTVFDISQTEGRALPSLSKNELQGELERYAELSEAITAASPVPIEFAPLSGAAKGCFSRLTERITIRSGMSQQQTVKTMLHEISHAVLHNNKQDASSGKDRRTCEVEAESVAYVVCKHFGIDTGDYSFGYIAGWSSGKELAELNAALDTIRACAASLIEDIEKSCPSLQVQIKQQAAQER